MFSPTTCLSIRRQQTVIVIVIVSVLALLYRPVFAADDDKPIEADVLENIGDETAEIDENALSPSTPPALNGIDPILLDGDELARYLDRGTVSESLNVNGEKVMALFKNETLGDTKGALLIIHDQGHNPDWPGPIRAIRRALPEYGWSTFAVHIGNPKPKVLTSNALSSNETDPDLEKFLGDRYRAAFDYLNAKGLFNIAVVAQGVHAGYTSLILKNIPPKSIAGFISLNTKTSIAPAEAEIAEAYSLIQAPVLDLIPEINRGGAFAQLRIDKAKQSGKNNFQQYAIPSSDPSFTGAEDFLIKRIRGWLKTNASGVQARLKKPSK